MIDYQDKIEKIKDEAKEFDVITLVETEPLIDKIIELTLNGEDIDDLLLDVMELGFEELSPQFDKVQSIAEEEVARDLAEAK